jgi:hypothetical protein
MQVRVREKADAADSTIAMITGMKAGVTGPTEAVTTGPGESSEDLTKISFFTSLKLQMADTGFSLNSFSCTFLNYFSFNRFFFQLLFSLQSIALNSFFRPERE